MCEDILLFQKSSRLPSTLAGQRRAVLGPAHWRISPGRTHFLTAAAAAAGKCPNVNTSYLVLVRTLSQFRECELWKNDQMWLKLKKLCCRFLHLSPGWRSLVRNLELNMGCKKSRNNWTLKYEQSGGPGEAGGGGPPLPGSWLFNIPQMIEILLILVV